MRDAKLKPVTIDHPDGNVGPDNYKNVAVGHLGELMSELDGERLGASALITNADAIARVEKYHAELSCGYMVDVEEELGEVNGVPYHYKTVGHLKINHVAIVDRGRCGSTVRIFDTQTSEETEMDKKEITQMVKDAVTEEMKVLNDNGNGKTGESKMTPIEMELMTTKLGEAVSRKLEDSLAAIQAKVDAEAAAKTLADTDAVKRALEIANGVNTRIELLADAQHLLTPEQLKGVADKSEKEVLVACVGDAVKDADKKDEAYLRGVVQMLLTDRSKGKVMRDRASQEQVSGDVPTDFLSLRSVLGAHDAVAAK